MATYEITRTSMSFSNNQPCEKAYVGKIKEYGQWTERIWYIDINSLEELQSLIKEVGHSVIVGEDHIEIYDGYRE